MSKETNQVEDIFREAFENYEVDPGSNAWQAIQSKIAAEGTAAASAASTTAAASSSSWVATAIVATVISATAIGGYFFFNDTAEKIKGKTQQTETKEKTEPTESINDQTENLNQEVIVDPKTTQADVNTKSEELPTSSKSSAQEKQFTNQKDDSKSIADKKVSNKTTPYNSDEDLKENEEAKEVADVTNNQSANLDKEQTSSTTDIEKSVVEENKGLPAKEENDVEKEPSVSKTTSPSEKTHENEVEPPNYIHLPNVFSPNQDGSNDEFEISIEDEDFDKFHIQIFTKSGQKVFESIDINDRWQGDLPNGSAAPNGFYFYQIVVEKDGKAFPKTGSVSLTR